MATPATSSSLKAGQLIFKIVFLGKSISLIFGKNLLIKEAVASKYSGSLPRLARETAILGYPSIAPSIAQLTVPEYKISAPKFGPWLIPDMTTSGFSSSARIAERAILTQSPGVPVVTQLLFTPNLGSSSSTRRGV